VPETRGKTLTRASQLVWGAVAVAAILFMFKPHIESAGGEVLAAAQRKKMPDIAMHDLNGGEWRLSEHRGRVALVNFWASWCPPCRQETPGFVRLSNDYRNRGLDLAGVSMDNSDAPVRRFVKSYGVPYPILLPPPDLPLLSAIDALPTTFLIDKQGRIAKTYIGAAREAEVRADVDRLLAES